MSPVPSGSTPSTLRLRRIKSQVFNSAFPTPPQRSRTEVSAAEDGMSSTRKLFTLFRPASTPPERPTSRHRLISGFNQDHSTTMEVDASWLRTTLSKKNSQYYDEAFAYRGPTDAARIRTARDGLVSADLSLNCVLDCEQDFIIDLAFLLSEIYQRPAECIMVWVNTDFNALLQNSSDPAYKISITALGSEIAATKNRRTAGLLQDFMAETARIPASRGALLFHTIEEQNIVLNGLSSHGGHEQSDLDSSGDSSVPKIIKPKSRRGRKSSLAKPAITPNDAAVGSRGRFSSFKPDTSITDCTSMAGTDKKKVKKRKSLMALLGF